MSDRLTIAVLVVVAFAIRRARWLAPAALAVAVTGLALELRAVSQIAALTAVIVTSLSLGYTLGRLRMPTR